MSTTIEWAEDVWNPLAGCKEVSPGCTHCYAAGFAHRLAAMGHAKYQGTTERKAGRVVWTGRINTDAEALLAPLKRRKPTRYFVNSMSDLFHEAAPLEFVAQVFAVMGLAPWHTFLVLTKRPEAMCRFVGAPNALDTTDEVAFALTHESCNGGLYDGFPGEWPLPNVWLGVSAEDQPRLDQRWPWLKRTPAAVRFLSLEPLLGPVAPGDCLPVCDCLIPTLEGAGQHAPNCRVFRPAVDWVIVGGESGPDARPMHPSWARSVRDQCRAAGVPFFFKQWGEWAPWIPSHSVGTVSHIRDDGTLHREPVSAGASGQPMARVGKKAAGRLLDGCAYNEYPAAAGDAGDRTGGP